MASLWGSPSSGLLLALGAVLAMIAIFLVVPATQVRGPWFDLDEVLYVLACGVLLLGGIGLAVPALRSSDAATGWVLALGLLLQTAGLGARAVRAQLTWGAYWSWGPVGCWRMAAWLTKAISAVGVWRIGWSGRRARVALLAAMAMAILVLLGSVPLVRWLGLDSPHLSL